MCSFLSQFTIFTTNYRQELPRVIFLFLFSLDQVSWFIHMTMMTKDRTIIKISMQCTSTIRVSHVLSLYFLGWFFGFSDCELLAVVLSWRTDWWWRDNILCAFTHPSSQQFIFSYDFDDNSPVFCFLVCPKISHVVIIKLVHGPSWTYVYKNAETWK